MPTVSYTIGMSQPHSHLFEVEIAVSEVSGPTLDFILPSWTPGSYMIREYARHVQEFAAHGGEKPLKWQKVAKDTWRVETDGNAQLKVSYKVYAYELTVRTSHLDGSHGYFNGATVCMYVPERMNEPLAVDIVVPEGWKVATGLEPVAAHPDAQGSRFSFLAEDYDELVDCPVECGTHRLLTFHVDGKEHRVVMWGRGNEDEEQVVEDTQRIVEVQCELFGGLPYKDYTFILHLADGRGGLEHRNSVTNLVDRWTFGTPRGYESFLALQSHEFFHVWNVKRLRVAPLGPFDYRNENYTRQLWAMEGVTSYYDKLLLVRAGLMTPERFLEIQAANILLLHSQPGRHIQSLETSSFDAWIKFYRPDENSANTSISYYLKGALVTLLLDMEIRARTNGARSMDDVLRYLYATYPIDGPGIPEDGAYRAAIEQIAGGDFSDFFARYIAGTDELDYDRALAHAGVELRWGHQHGSGTAPAWLGITTRNDGGRLKVATTRSNGPAAQAGVYANDELLALDGWRVDGSSLEDRIAERHPGDTVTLALFRRNELHMVPVTLAEAPCDRLRFVRVEQPTELQERIFNDWLRTTSPAR